MSETRQFTLDMLIQLALEARLSELHVSLPCKVVTYDAAKQTVDLAPLIKRKRKGLDGTSEVTELPSLQKVPVAFPRTAGGWITFPIQAGDVGFAIFSERSIADWMGKSAGSVVEHSDDTLHPFGGAWFHPGGYPAASPISGGADASNVVIHTASMLDLGERNLTPADLVAIGALVDARLLTVQTSFDTHVHPSGMGPTGVPAVPIGSLASTKATKVRAK